MAQVLKLWVIALSFVVFAPRASAQKPPKAHVSMIASASRVAVGEPFGLEVRADVSGDDVEDVELPDFGALEVLGKRVSRPFSFSFGFGNGQQAQVRNEVVYGFTLRATRAGTFKIPPAIVVLGKRKVATQAVTVEAVDDPNGALQRRAVPQRPGIPQIPGFPQIPGMPQLSGVPDEPAVDDKVNPPPVGDLDGARFDQNMFVRTVVDKKSAFVGEQTTVTVYLYMRGGLSQNPTVTREPTTDGFWVHDLLPMQRNLSSVRQEVQGRAFNVYVLRRYAAFPMRPGTLEIGAPVVELSAGQSLFDLLNGPQKPVKREGVAVRVEAKPLPSPPRDVQAVHVGTLKLTASLSQADAKVGDGVTLELRAEGTGNLRELHIPAPSVQGLEILSPELRDDLSTPLDQLGGKRTFKFLVLPRAAGAPVLPPFRVAVFDPEKSTFGVVATPALNLRVTEQPGAKPLDPAPAQPSADADGDDAVHFDPPRLQSALARRHTPLDGEPWYPWVVLSVPAVAALAYLAQAWLARQRRRRAAYTPSADQRAQALLDEAAIQSDPRRGLAAVARALHAAIEGFAGQSLGGFPASAVAGKLADLGLVREDATRIGQLLERIDEARFLPAASGPELLRELTQYARHAMQVLARARRKP